MFISVLFLYILSFQKGNLLAHGDQSLPLGIQFLPSEHLESEPFFKLKVFLVVFELDKLY